TRDHTERMLRARGVAVRSEADGRGARVSIDGGQKVGAADEQVPGDPSAAAFWLVASAIHPAAELRLRGVGTNPTRRGVIDVLRRAGTAIDEVETEVGGGQDAPDVGDRADGETGEPVADLVVRSSQLEAFEMEPAETAAAIDEVPVLCLAA